MLAFDLIEKDIGRSDGAGMTHESDQSESASWWDTGRDWKAFAIAPLIAPVVVGFQFGSAGAPGSVAVFIAPIVLVMAYAGTFLLGRPLYALLRALKLTAFWPAPIAGIFVGFVVVYVFIIVVSKDTGQFSDALKYGAPSGAAIGALLWWIGRPDLEDPSAKKLILPKFNWNTARMLIAFSVAPFAVPIAALIFPDKGFDPVLAYAIALFMSVALFRILRELELNGFWIVFVTGSAIGLITILFFAILAPDPARVLMGQFGLASVVFVLSGAIAGAIFWLIARPDRNVAAGSTPSN